MEGILHDKYHYILKLLHIQSNTDISRPPALYYIISHNINGGNITTTNMTSIVFTYNTIIPGVYNINVSAVNILGESLQRNVEGI